MAGRLVNRKDFGSTLRNDIFDTFKKYSDETKIPKSKILDMALEDYFKKINVEIKEGE